VNLPKMREAPEGAPGSHLAEALGSGSVGARDNNDEASLANRSAGTTPKRVGQRFSPTVGLVSPRPFSGLDIIKGDTASTARAAGSGRRKPWERP
jgi:hypothetical protein